MRIHELFLFSLALLLQPSTAAEVPEDFQLRQLTDDTFRQSTAQGLWLVEHFSPKCSHCKAFAPTWEQLAKEKLHLERLSGFHMAQVNCLAQGDLCNTNGIKFYPQLMLFSNGQAVPSYSGDRSLADLSTFIDTQATAYARGQLSASPEEKEVVSSGFGRPNPEGKVIEVDEGGLEVMKGNGPVIVDFFAPWCGHCRKLRPIYEQVAAGLKGKLTVAAVDCEAHKAFCRKEQVNGYPTIRLFRHGTQTDYTEARTKDKIQKFASKAVDPKAMQTIKLDDFDEIVRSDEAFFLYLQNFDTSVSDLNAVKSALEPLLGFVPSYTSADPLLYANLTIANPPPTSILLAFSSYSALPEGSLPFPASDKQITRFITSHRFPTLVQLSSSNYNDIMKSESRALVVLGAVHRGDQGHQEREQLQSMARAWKRGGRDFAQPVWFVWVESEKWSGWLRQSYEIKKKEVPAVVVIDPALNHYYDMTIEGSKIAFTGASVFSVLEGVYQHFLRPKISETTLEWGSRSATMTLITLGHATMDHPLFALVSVVGGVAVFVFLLQKCIPRDPREGNGSNGSRLD